MGLPETRLSLYDLHHGHVFLSESGRIGVLFHGAEYPAYDEQLFPYRECFCSLCRISRCEHPFVSKLMLRSLQISGAVRPSPTCSCQRSRGPSTFATTSGMPTISGG